MDGFMSVHEKIHRKILELLYTKPQEFVFVRGYNRTFKVVPNENGEFSNTVTIDDSPTSYSGPSDPLRNYNTTLTFKKVCFIASNGYREYSYVTY